MKAMKTISTLIFCSICLSIFIPTANSAESETKQTVHAEKKNSLKTNVTKSQRRHIESLIDQLYRTEAVLAYTKQMQSLSNLEQKVNEYKMKLSEISKNPPYDPDEKLPKILEDAKKTYGDDWNRIHSQLRSVLTFSTLSELLDTEFEPFIRFSTVISSPALFRVKGRHFLLAAPC